MRATSLMFCPADGHHSRTVVAVALVNGPTLTYSTGHEKPCMILRPAESVAIKVTTVALLGAYGGYGGNDCGLWVKAGDSDQFVWSCRTARQGAEAGL